MSVLVYTETDKGKFKKSAFEVASYAFDVAKKLGEKVTAVAFNAEDPSDRKKAKNMLKKLQKIMWGQEKQKIIIEDPSGNSAIVSDKAERSKLKVSK